MKCYGCSCVALRVILKDFSKYIGPEPFHQNKVCTFSRGAYFEESCLFCGLDSNLSPDFHLPVSVSHRMRDSDGHTSSEISYWFMTVTPNLLDIMQTQCVVEGEMWLGLRSTSGFQSSKDRWSQAQKPVISPPADSAVGWSWDPVLCKIWTNKTA